MPFRFADLARRLFPRPAPRSTTRRPRLTLQSLEGRDVPSVNPVARDDAYSLHQGAASTVLGSVLANDEGGTVPLKGYVTAPATAGTTFAFNSFGASVRYKPKAGTIAADGTITNGFTGDDYFEYVLKQGAYTSPPATGTITVTNHAPVAATPSVVFQTGVNQSFHKDRATLLAAVGASDADGDTLGIVTADKAKTNVVIDTAAGGRAWLNWQTGFSYNPPSSTFTGWDSFQLRVWDKAGFSGIVTVHVWVGSGAAPDRPAVSVAKTHDAAEGGAAGVAATFTFTRTGDKTNALTVNFDVDADVDEAAEEGTDYEFEVNGVVLMSRTITFAAGSDTVVLTAVPKADNEFEETETIAVSISDPPAGTEYTAAIGNVVTADLTDDPPVVTYAATWNAAGSPERGRVTLTRSGGDLTQPLEVWFEPKGTLTIGGEPVTATMAFTAEFEANVTSFEVPLLTEDGADGNSSFVAAGATPEGIRADRSQEMLNKLNGSDNAFLDFIGVVNELGKPITYSEYQVLKAVSNRTILDVRFGIPNPGAADLARTVADQALQNAVIDWRTIPTGLDAVVGGVTAVAAPLTVKGWLSIKLKLDEAITQMGSGSFPTRQKGNRTAAKLLGDSLEGGDMGRAALIYGALTEEFNTGGFESARRARIILDQYKDNLLLKSYLQAKVAAAKNALPGGP